MIEVVKKIPSLLDFSQIAFRRGLLVKNEDEYLLQRLEAGAIGEEFVYASLKKYGCSHWQFFQNVWLDFYGTYESDMILLTNHAIYVFEIKNFDGTFEYEQGQCRINGRVIASNCVFQAERALMNLQSICQEISPNLPVRGALLFVGEHNQVSIKSKVNGISVVTRNQLRDFIRRIAHEEAQSGRNSIDSSQLITQFEKYRIPNPFSPTSYTVDNLLKAKKGIYCKKCHGNDLRIRKAYVDCACGFQESREEAVLRTICEYGTLVFGEDFLSRKHVYDFLGREVSRNYLIRLLKKHFPSYYGGRSTKYLNYKLPYSKINDYFELS